MSIYFTDYKSTALVPKSLKKAFEEFETLQPSTDPDFAIPPRDVTQLAKDFLLFVDWDETAPPQIYTFDDSIDMVWRGIGITVHPGGIDVYSDPANDSFIINASLKDALKTAKFSKN